MKQARKVVKQTTSHMTCSQTTEIQFKLETKTEHTVVILLSSVLKKNVCGIDFSSPITALVFAKSYLTTRVLDGFSHFCFCFIEPYR